MKIRMEIKRENKIFGTSDITFVGEKNKFQKIGICFVIFFALFFISNIVSAADTTRPDVNITYSANTTGTGTETITANYSESIIGTPTISINQPGSQDILNVPMTAPASTWTSRIPAQVNSWLSVAYGNGLFVAVTNSGTNQVMTSSDGITWTSRDAASVGQWNSIVYGNGLFVAVGSTGVNRVMTSTDGITWTSRTATELNNWNSVVYGGGLFVAVAESGTNRVMTSIDGINWTARAAASASQWKSVAYGNGLYVAVAYNSNAIMTSPNGITWTARTAAANTYWYGIAYGNGLFVAVAYSSGQIMTSPDGITWTLRTNPSGNYWYSVSFANGLFVTTGQGSIMTSVDGITWVNKAVSGGQYSVAYANGMFVVVGNSGYVLTSNANFTYDYFVTKADGSAFIDGQATVTLSAVTDLALNISNTPTNNTFMIDTTGPTVSLTYSANRAKAGYQTITATYSENIIGTPSITINQQGLADIFSAPMTGSGNVFTYSYLVNTNNGVGYLDGSAIVNLSQVLSTTGRASQSPTNNSFIIDTTLPTVVFTYNPNPTRVGTETIIVTYSEEIIGTPTISINQPGTSDISNATLTNIGASNWTARVPYTGWNWQSVTYGYGQFVAVASNGQIVTSVDGISWTNRGTPTEANNWQSVTYGNGLFVAVANTGTNRVMTSIDGISWTNRSTPELNNWQSVTYGNGKFVAVATTGANRVMTSVDGISWITRSAAEANTWQSVTYGGGQFVAVSLDGINKVMTSSDGISWVARQAATSNLWQSVTYGNGLYVAVAYGAVMTSVDGITWVSRTAAEANTWQAVTYGNGTFVAVAVDGENRVMTSTNGINWFAKLASEPNGWKTVGYGNGMFVALADSGSNNRAMSSPAISYSYTYSINNANGSSYIDGQAVVTLSFVTDMAANTVIPLSASNQITGNRFIIDTTVGNVALSYSANPAGTGINTISAQYSEAISTNPTVSIDQPGSADIVNATMTPPASQWVSRTAPQLNSWQAVTYGNGLFVAVSQNGTNRVMTSTDGITWQPQNAAAVDYWTSVTYGNGLFVATSNYGGVMTSTNGINWTLRVSALSSYIYGVTYGNGLYVAVGSAGVMTSQNGITWTARTPAVSSSWYSVVYGNSQFVAVSNAGLVMTSVDGINWISRESAGTSALFSVTYGNGIYVASGSAIIMTSTDAITWTYRTPSYPGITWYSIAYGNGLFVTVSTSGYVMTSINGINWTTQTTASVSGWYGVAFGNGNFVAVAGNGQIMSSRAPGYYYDYNVNKANGSTYIDGAATVSLSATSDMAGNVINPPSNNTFNINTSASTVALSYTRARINAGTQLITATYSKNVIGTPTISIEQQGSTDITNVSMVGSGKVFTYSYTVNSANGGTYIDGQVTVSLSPMIDIDSNISLAPTNATFIIDTTSPSVALTYTSPITKAGIQTITATYSEVTSAVPTVSINQPGETDILNATMQGSGTVFTYDYQVYGSNGSTYIDGLATVSLSAVSDLDDNLFTPPSNNTFTIDTTGTSVTLSYSSNPTKAGVNTITATYSKAVTSIPNISINQQGTTDIVNAQMQGSDNIYTYDYTVNTATGNTYLDGQATVTLSSVIDIDGNASTNSINNTFIIDTNIPTVAISYSANPTTVGNLIITATYSKLIVGTPTISINQPGSTDIVNAPMSGSAFVYTYTYNVNTANGSSYIDGLATITLSSQSDPAGNAATLPTNNTFTIETNGPTVALSYSANPAGVGIETISAEYSQAIVGVPNISVNQPGTGDISNVPMTLPMTTWTYRTAAEANSWKAVVYGNGLFVAVSSDGANRVMTSTDGLYWTARVAPAGAWVHLIYANNQFIAVGANSLMTSPDGITWTNKNVPFFNWNSVTYGNGLYVAVATGGQVMTSPDSNIWTSRAAASASQWNSVAYGNGTYVAVAYGGQIMSSTDGISWTSRTTSPFTQYLFSITYGNGLFVSYSTYGSNAITSPDGINWTVSGGLISYVNPVLYLNNQFVALSNSYANYRTSIDGINWATTQVLPSIGSYMAYGNGVYVVINSNLVLTSSSKYTYDYSVNKDNGTTYVDGIATVSLSSVTNQAGKRSNEPTNNTFNIDTTGSTVSLSYTANRAKAGVQTITATYTEDIIGVPSVSINQPGITDVLNAPMQGSARVYTYNYTVNQNNGTNYIDGIARVSLSPITNTAGKITSSPTNNTFIIDTTLPTVVFSYSPNPTKVGTETITATYSEEIIGTPTISIDQPGSTDIVNDTLTNIGGTTWTTRNINGYSWQSVVYGGGLFVAVSTTNRVSTSPDGINWTERIVPESNQWMSVTYANGLYVAVSPTGINRVMTSTDGITWMASRASEDNSWQSVTYGNGIFVAVSYSGINRVMTSSDGITWTSRSASENNSWQSITYGNGLFVAVANYGTNQVMTSPDGITWTSRQAVSQSGWQSVTYGGGKFVAVAYYGSKQIMTSLDGITWISRITPEANSWYSVTYGNGQYVAVAVDGTNRVMTSPDAITWTSKLLSNTNSWQSVVYGNGTFVAVASSGPVARAMTSPSVDYSYTYIVNQANGSTYKDGQAQVNLSSITDTAGNLLVLPTAINPLTGNRFIIDTTPANVALSYSANPAGTGVATVTALYSEAIATIPTINIDQQGSTDIVNAPMTPPGTVFNTQTSPAPATTWRSVTYGNGIYVAVGDSGTNRVMTSTDGITWVARNASLATYWYSVAYGSGLFVAVGNGGALMTSPNGINWTTRTAANGTSWMSVVYNSGVFVSVGNNAAMTSADGINWILRTTPTGSWYSVIYANGQYVAMNQSSGVGVNQIMTSPDGITWTGRKGAEAYSWYGIAYGNGVYVQVSNNTLAMTSTDLVNWTTRTTGVGPNLYSLSFGGGLFMAAGHNGSISTSADGITWTSRSTPVANIWQGLTYANRMFVVVGTNGGIATSRAGGYYYDYTVVKTNGTTYLDGQANVTLSQTTDISGNTTNLPTNTGFMIDTSSSSVAITYSSDRASVGPQVITATYSKQIIGIPYISIDQRGTTDIINAPMQGGGNVFTYTYNVNQANGTTYSDGEATVTLSAVNDVDGNAARNPTNTTFIIDTGSPSAVISYSLNRPVKQGTPIVITATFSEIMADYPYPKIAISGANTLASTNMVKVDSSHYTYNYTVEAGNGLSTVALSAGTDIVGNIVTAIPTSGATFIVDNTNPTVVITPICTTVGNGCTIPGAGSSPQEAYNIQSIRGTASGADLGGSISSVDISIKDTTTNLWYNGTSFTSGIESYQPTVGTTAWSYSLITGALVIGHTYSVNIKAIDEALNQQIQPFSFKFTNSPPIISNVTATQAQSGEVNVGFNVTDTEASQTTNYLFYGVEVTLAADVTSGSNFLTVSDGSNFPMEGSILIEDEIISYVSRSGNTLQGASRGVNNTTAFAHLSGLPVYILGNSVSGTGVGQSNIGNNKSITWLAQVDADGYQSQNAVVKIVANDGSNSSMIGSALSATFSLDAAKPESVVTFDAGIAGMTNGATIHIPMPENKTSVDYRITDDSATNSSVVTTGWVTMTDDVVIPWTFDMDIEAKVLKYQFKDIFNNVTPEVIIRTPTPISTSSYIIQDTSNLSAIPPYYDAYIGWQSTEAEGFASYRLEEATSPDGVTYGTYTSVSDTSFSYVASNYYIYRNLNPALFYRFRLAVVGLDGNTSVRTNSITVKPDGVQNFGEGGGGSILAASKVENVIVTQATDKKVRATFKLTDSTLNKKINPSYESYLFYNIGIKLPANAQGTDAITVSDASKLKSTGYIQINNEVIRYTSKSGNILSGITRGTWPTTYSSGRSTRTNPSLLEGTPVWIMANSTSPISVTNSTIPLGQNNTIDWNTYDEVALAGSSYSNTGIRVLVHDNQDVLSGPLSSQNDFSENGILNNLDLSAPSITFDTTSSSGLESVSPAFFNLTQARAYPLNSTVNYTVSGSAVGGGVDYTLASGTLVIPAGSTTAILSASIVNHNLARANKTIIVTLSNPSNAILGTNKTHTYTIINHGVDVTAPVVTLIGSNQIHVLSTNTFTDPGATALDETDGDLTSGIIVTGNVDINTPSEIPYILTYSATDTSGNVGSITREVYVDDVNAVTHNILSSAGGNGTITPEGSVNVTVHNNQTYTITPNANYKIDTLTVDGVSLAPVSSYTFTDVTTSHTINATFTSIIDVGAPVITLNGSPIVSIIKDGAYEELGATATDATDGVIPVVITGSVISSIPGTYTITYSATDLSGNTSVKTRTVYVTLAENYDITATAGTNGSISPAGTTSVLSNASQTYTIIPNANYKINTLTVDGVSLSPVGSYTFSNVTTTHTISTTFSLIADVGAPVITINGSAIISLTKGETYVEYGATALDATDGVITVVTTGSVISSIPGSYTITYTATDLSGNTAVKTRTVNVILAQNYAITASVGANGSISPAGTTNVLANASQTYTITPNANYKIDTLTVDGVSLSPVSSYTFANVAGVHTINATFTLIIDVGAPVITLNGSPIISLTKGEAYVEYGATATDATDGVITVVITGSVISSIPGTYTITYSATDLSGNTSVRTRTVYVTLAQTYDITASVGANGVISPAGTTNVISGANQTYTIVPVSGYNIATLVVDGVNLAVSNSYTFLNVTSNHSISATFTQTELRTLGFLTLSSSAREDIAGTVSIPVAIPSPYLEDITFSYSAVGSLAEGNGVDYLMEAGTGTISAGQTSTNIDLVILDDNTSEPTETVIITLSNPVNATLGANTIYAFSILDDDIEVTNIESANIKATSARLIWTTADFTDSLVEFGTIPPGEPGAYNLSNYNGEKVLNHEIYLGGLTPSTTYYTRTTSVNIALQSTVVEGQFTTTAGAIISNVTSTNITDTSAVITWSTDIEASSYVSYSTDEGLGDATGTSSLQLVTEHSVTLINLLSDAHYYFQVTSTDINSNVTEEANNGSYFSFYTAPDETAPVISEISVPIITASQIAVVWKTNEVTNGQVRYGTVSGNYDYETELIETPLSNHLAAINGLTEETTYYYVVVSADLNGNETISEEQSVRTTAIEKVIIKEGGGGGGMSGVAQEIYDIILAENEAYKLKFGSDASVPGISNIEVKDITPFGATVSFVTTSDTVAFVKYGKDNKYGLISGDDNYTKIHSIKINGLTLGTKYFFLVKVMDKSSQISLSEENSFTTKFLTEDLEELKNIDNIEQFQAEIEATIESILPSLVPPFIDKPTFTEITENSALVSFKTNIKAYAVISYADDGTYDILKANPYNGEMSNITDKNITHSLTLIGLKPNMKYHVMVKAFSLPQVVGKTEDLTFTTKASKIRGSILDVKKDSFNVVWGTDEPTTSIIEYKNLTTGRTSRIADGAMNSSHLIKVENLSPGTRYLVTISGINSKGNLVESGEPIQVITSTDNKAPVISNLKVESALIVGRDDRVQTIVTWQTDEPSTSTIYFEEGSGLSTDTLGNKQEDLELNMSHVLILTVLKPGTVYRFTVASTDDANNTVKPPIRTIITPQKTESILDIIFKNFDETFNFMNNVN